MPLKTIEVVCLVLVPLLTILTAKESGLGSLLRDEVNQESIIRRSTDGLTWNLVRILVDEQRERQNLMKEFQHIKKTLDDVQRELKHKNENLEHIKLQRKKLIKAVKYIKGDLKTELEKLLKEEFGGKIVNISENIAKLTKKVTTIHLKGTATEVKINQIAKHDRHTKTQINNVRGRVDNLEIKVSKKRSGAVYIRWGRLSCPNNTDLIYSGRLGGNRHSSTSGPSNYQCLPDDPDYREYQSGNQGTFIYGGEYEVGGYTQREVLHKSYYNYDVVCSACQSKQNTATIMIPGKSKCYDGWYMEYRGYLMAGGHSHAASNYICVDANPDVVRGSNGNTDQVLVYAVQSMCGGLKCPPYKHN